MSLHLQWIIFQNLKFSNLLDEKRTVITVAHRISTVKNFDKIILMDNGEIVCIGEHEDLIENSELYRSLYYKNNNLEVQNEKRGFTYILISYIFNIRNNRLCIRSFK